MLLIRVHGDLCRFKESNNVRGIDGPRNKTRRWNSEYRFRCLSWRTNEWNEREKFCCLVLCWWHNWTRHEPKAKCLGTVWTLPAVLKGTTPCSKLWKDGRTSEPTLKQIAYRREDQLDAQVEHRASKRSERTPFNKWTVVFCSHLNCLHGLTL